MPTETAPDSEVKEYEQLVEPDAPAVVEPEAKEPETEPKPGTPDKIVQKVQQEQSALNKKLDTLLEKIDQQGGTATPQQVEQVREASKRLEKVRAILTEGRDWEVTDTAEVARGLVDTDSRIDQLESELKAAREEHASTRELVAEVRIERMYRELERQYPGVDVRKVRRDAELEVFEIHGMDPDNPVLPEGVSNEALNRAIKKRQDAALAKAKPGAKPPATAKRQPPTTPGGGSVSIGSGAAPVPSPEDAELAEYRQLYVP